MYDFLVYKIEMAFECTVSISTLKNNRSIGNSTNTQFILLDLLFTFSSVARLRFFFAFAEIVVLSVWNEIVEEHTVRKCARTTL